MFGNFRVTLFSLPLPASSRTPPSEILRYLAQSAFRGEYRPTARVAKSWPSSRQSRTIRLRAGSSRNRWKTPQHRSNSADIGLRSGLQYPAGKCRLRRLSCKSELCEPDSGTRCSGAHPGRRGRSPVKAPFGFTDLSGRCWRRHRAKFRRKSASIRPAEVGLQDRPNSGQLWPSSPRCPKSPQVGPNSALSLG